MRTGLRNHRRRQRTERGIASARAGRFATDVLEGLSLDQLVAERDEWEESGAAHEYSETCPCRDCRDITDEWKAAAEDYESMTTERIPW